MEKETQNPKTTKKVWKKWKRERKNKIKYGIPITREKSLVKQAGLKKLQICLLCWCFMFWSGNLFF